MTAKRFSVKNQATGAIVCQDAGIANSMWSRFKGLMMRKSLGEREGLLIQPCSSVHCFFMRFPIDVIFIDKESKVVRIVPSLKPWRLSLGGKGAHSALEMNGGAASGLVSVGDTLSFEPAEATAPATGP
jgi:uncharacterized protein